MSGIAQTSTVGVAPASQKADSKGASVGKKEQTNDAPKIAQPPAAASLQLLVPKDPARSIETTQYLGRDVAFKVAVEDRSFLQDPSALLSASALVVSILAAIFNVYFTRRGEATARRQSIHDDFWLRTVLYPLAIQPALDFYSKMSADLPLDRYSPTATPAAITAFKNTFEAGHNTVLSKVTSLKVSSDVLHDAVLDQLESIDDLVSDYCFANMNGYDPAASGTDNVRSLVGHKIAGHVRTALEAVKSSQSMMA